MKAWVKARGAVEPWRCMLFFSFDPSVSFADSSPERGAKALRRVYLSVSLTADSSPERGAKALPITNNNAYIAS